MDSPSTYGVGLGSSSMPIPVPIEGFSASNSTVSSPPDPRTPPALLASQDIYSQSSSQQSYGTSDSFVSDASTTTNHHHQPQQYQQQQQQFQPQHYGAVLHGDDALGRTASTTLGAAPAGSSRSLLLPPSPYTLHPISHSASTPKSGGYQQQSQAGSSSSLAGDYGYGLPPVTDGVDVVRHGSFSSVASSAGGGYDYEYVPPAQPQSNLGGVGDDDGPPGLEKAPPEITGAYTLHHVSQTHPWNHQQDPSYPPQHPPLSHHPAQHYQHQQQPISRRNSYLDDFYASTSRSPSTYEFPPPAANQQQQQHIPPPAHHPQQQQRELSPLSREHQPPLPRISTQFPNDADPSPPGTAWAGVSPELTQHQGPSSAVVSPTTTMNVGGAEYGAAGTGSTTSTPQHGMFSSQQQPLFARRFSSPGRGSSYVPAAAIAQGNSMTIGSAPGAGSPQSYHQPSSTVDSAYGNGNFAFRPPPLYDDSQDMSDRFEGVANGPPAQQPVAPSHTMTRHPSLPHLGRDAMYQQQQLPPQQSGYDSPPSLADSRYAHRSNSLPSGALLLNPLQLTGSQPSTLSPPQPHPHHTLFPHQQHRSLSLSKHHHHSNQAHHHAPPVGPIMHTDDAASKETANLRRKCHNCSTTEPPSWRRSTLAPGKIVCNRCGLYERTHLRPRPTGTGGELRKASISIAAAAASGRPVGLPASGGPPGLAPSPYTTSPVNSKTGAPVRTSKKAAATMAALGIQPHAPPPPPLQDEERALSSSFAAAVDWEDSKNVLAPQQHRYSMPSLSTEMSLRPVGAHSMQ